jgi:penicillin G amidase
MHVSVSAAQPRKSRIVFRSVVAVLVLLLVTFVAFDVWFYRAVRASLPQRDGTIRLNGLVAPVAVTYDALGVPNISASNLPDLFFAQGYVTAQDRLWQMDMIRRYASGDIAEVLGPGYVKIDRENRILGLRQVAERAVAAMDPEQRAHFDAYAAGVNAYIEQHHNSLPLEFRFLRYSPAPWTAQDSVLAGLAMTKFLNYGEYKEKLEKEKILAKLGPELSEDLFVNTSWRDHPPGSETDSIENDVPGETAPGQNEEHGAAQGNLGSHDYGEQSQEVTFARDNSTARHDGLKALGATVDKFALAAEQHLRPGSNNWVVSGAHTASGKPLLSNDMHLDLELPNVWYEAHLQAGDFDVAGVTLPGVPYVIVGHNQRIAWGFTNLGPNVEDLYVEKFNQQGEYLTPQGWMQPEHRKEIIHVKGKPDVTVDVVTTRHGPIITELIPGEQRKIALKWTIYDPQASRIPFFAVDSARNWQEFEAAFSQFGAPAQNVVYADMDGNIGYQATGLIPIRASGDGSVPEPGDDDAHEWTGYVPYDKLPSVYNPPSGIIATANGRVTPDNYPYELSIDWMAPYRTQRIYKLLEEPKKFTPADMLAIQTDVVSSFDRFCAERFVYAVDHSPNATARARSAADLMRNWDGSMDTDSAAATIAVFSRRELEEMLLRAKLGDQWQEYHRWMSPVWLEEILTHQPARWLPQSYPNYDELLTAAVDSAVTNASATQALSLWKWGRVNRVDIKHPFWSHFPILKREVGTVSQPMSGDDQTIKQIATAPHTGNGNPGLTLGPSERLTVDFSNLDESTLNIVNGQSGDPFDEHYNDQWDAYYHGRTFALPFSDDAVLHAARHHLKLMPQ